MKTLHLECAAGLGGDMFLAGLADLGLDLDELEAALSVAGIEAHLSCRSATRHGLAGKMLDIATQGEPSLRRLVEIERILAVLPLSRAVREKSLAAFERLAQVEAQAHGIDMHAVHFHELGAVDTLVDVVGVFWGLETLGIDRVFATALPWFSGRIQSAHGPLPLPAPAVVELLKNKPVYPTAYAVELITPTGALLLDQVVTEFGRAPCGILLDCGMGMGRMDLADQPNVLRCFLMDQTGGPLAGEANLAIEDIAVLETNIDHLTGEELGACLEALLQEGALDVLFLPGVMKKNRPGGLLQVLCRPGDLKPVQDAVFRHTMTLGIRRRTMQRVVLTRETRTRETPLGPLPMKETVLNGQAYPRPEHEALRQLARRTGRSVAQLRYLLGGRT